MTDAFYLSLRFHLGAMNSMEKISVTHMRMNNGLFAKVFFSRNSINGNENQLNLKIRLSAVQIVVLFLVSELLAHKLFFLKQIACNFLFWKNIFVDIVCCWLSV